MEIDYLYILIPILVGGITQITKFSIYSFKHGLDWNYFFTHGHMPSAYSAFITALIITISYYYGIASGAFLLSIIIFDKALRMKMYLGDQGRYLNNLVEKLEINPRKFPRLKKRVGHRTSEVIVGIIYGAILSAIFIYILSWLESLFFNCI